LLLIDCNYDVSHLPRISFQFMTEYYPKTENFGKETASLSVKDVSI
jgi:hypothetical protein